MDDKNDIVELRSHLFDALRQLKDKSNTVDLDRIKMINQTAQVIINSAKVEVDYAKATGHTSSSGFLTDSGTTGKPDGGYTHRIGQRHN